MPLYSYKCDCGEKTEEFRQIEARHLAPKCKCGKQMSRDIHADHCDEKRPGYWSEIFSEAMGVAPSQVAEHRKMHPDIPITDDGRVIVRSHQEHRRIMKKLGFVDRAGYH